MQRSLHTKRLSLDSFTLDDTIELHEIFSDPQTHTIGDGPFTSVSQTTSWIERRILARDADGLCWYGLRDQNTGRLIGNCGVFVGRTGVAEPELGYEIRRECQGKGYASEAALAAVAEAERVGIARVWATIRPTNVASLRVVERIGMVAQRF